MSRACGWRVKGFLVHAWRTPGRDFGTGDATHSRPARRAGPTGASAPKIKVHWFKGGIAEVRISPPALPAEKLQRVEAK
jgi:hypothetical protein